MFCNFLLSNENKIHSFSELKKTDFSFLTVFDVLSWQININSKVTLYANRLIAHGNHCKCILVLEADTDYTSYSAL